MKNKNGLEYYLQSDVRWKDEVMTFPEWQEKPDTWGSFGCLGTASLNVHNDFFKDDITPRMLNDQLRNNNGYNYFYYKDLYNNNMKAVYEACYQSESKLRWDILIKLLGIKTLIRDYQGFIDLNPVNEYFLIKVPYKNTGHWCFITRAPDKTKNSVYYFDVYDNLIKKPIKVLEIIKIIF